MADHYRYLITNGFARDVPVWFLEREQPAPQHLFFWDAFWELSNDRQMGMGIGPIPHTSLQAYCDRLGLDDDFAETVRRIIRAMDREFMKLAGKKPEVDPDS